MWYIGQQVVCIKKSAFCYEIENLCVPIHPTINNIYTIREIRQCSDDPEYLCFCVEEIHNSVVMDGWAKKRQELAFHELCFRPVKETDISVFTEILTKIKEDA